MSSLKLADRRFDAGTEEPDAVSWVKVESPLRDRSQPPSGAGVIVAIARLRRRYAQGSDGTVTIDDSAEYGGGDATLADAIDRTIDSTWDD